MHDSFQQSKRNGSRVFITDFGQYRLSRIPARKNELLQAWDAADEYALNALASDFKPDETASILICNDAFGALAVALHDYQLHVWSDSWISHQATRQNFQDNNLKTDKLTLIDSLSMPAVKISLVILKVPKSMTFLQYQLACLSSMLQSGTPVIVAGMQKNTPSRVWRLLEKYLGTTTTSLARKKARLITVNFSENCANQSFAGTASYRLPGTEYDIINYANVFSRDKPDIGSRFFLQHFPVMDEACEIVDLGCGNGILGLMAAEKMPTARIHFVDESYMAVESARLNFHNAFHGQRKAVFHVGDGLKDYPLDNVDLVLCNPPFHQQHTVGDFIARRMFQQSRKVLRQGGQLWVIGNRHLGYHKTLKRYFKRVELVASNKKFVVLKALVESDSP